MSSKARSINNIGGGEGIPFSLKGQIKTWQLIFRSKTEAIGKYPLMLLIHKKMTNLKVNLIISPKQTHKLFYDH